jgi:CubicO group peptidase (beta-lactamase class C family)/uncharacterized protein (DUF302 family)
MKNILRKTPTFFLAAGLFVAAANTGSAQRGNAAVQFAGQTIDEMVAGFMRENHIPGMTLAIVQAPYISRVTGYGFADQEKGLLASPKTLWNIGQLTEAHTAVAILQLVEAGKLSLEDSIGQHVNGLPETWRQVTLRQLLAHASGFPDYTQQPSYRAARKPRPEGVLELMKDTPTVFPPGARVANSATDTMLLRLTVERVSGTNYEAFVTQNQFERLGLKNTAFVSRLEGVVREEAEPMNGKHQKFLHERTFIDPTESAVGYSEQDGKCLPLPRNWQAAAPGNDPLLASAEDISLWDIGLAGSLLVSQKENRGFIYNAVKLPDGSVASEHCGWRFQGHKGLMDIRGNAPGFSSYLCRFTDPSELLCVTLCANKQGVELTELARRIAGAFNPKLGPPVGPQVMQCLESPHPLAKTVDRLVAFMKSRSIASLSKVAEQPSKKGADHNPPAPLIPSHATAGNEFILSRPGVTLNPPIRVAVWQEADGSVWVGRPNVQEVAQQPGSENQTAKVAAMQAAVAAAMAEATEAF